MSNSKDSDQVMDVKKPGDTPASPTSRPIIVGHGSIMKDPMVRQDEKKPATDIPSEETKKETLTPHAEVVIAPLASAASQDDKADPEQAVTDDTEQVSESNTEAQSETSEMDDDGVDSVDTDGGVIQAVVGKADQKTKERQAAEAEAEKQAAIQQLIKDKKYFVPIEQAHKAKHGLGLFLVVAVLVIVLVGYALIDIEVLDPGFDVPFHILNT